MGITLISYEPGAGAPASPKRPYPSGGFGKGNDPNCMASGGVPFLSAGEGLPQQHQTVPQLAANGRDLETGRPVVALDMDLTIYAWHKAHKVQLGKQYTLPEDYEENYDNNSSLEAHRAAGLLEGAREAMQAIDQAGYEIYIMTLRRPQSEATTKRFIAEMGLPVREILVQKPFDKVGLCNEFGVKMIVDDAPKTIQAAAERGVKAATLEYDFNSEIAESSGAIRGKSWGELGPQVIAELDRLYGQDAQAEKTAQAVPTS